MKRFLIGCSLIGLIVGLVGCRSMMYSAYEKVGIYKRDLLKKAVVAARDEEKGAQTEFKDALTRLKELTGYDGGALEKKYRQLQGDYDDAAARVAAVHKRISDVETVSSDLFKEWEKENDQIETPSLRDTSRNQLEDTRRKNAQVITALKAAERNMDPVLHKLHDYVLVLKHSLNAAAIASLGTESAKIQDDISKLLDDMSHSIAQADEYVKQMPK